MSIRIVFMAMNIILLVGIAGCLIGIIRTNWVYRERRKLIEGHSKQISDEIKALTLSEVGGYDPIKRWDELEGEYLSFDGMMKLRYWHIWDVEKLKKK